MPAGRPRQDAARRVERAERILDAAGELIVRWGYDKTTIEDVARASHVAKGTVYLHWRSREDLFVALLRRERARLLTEVERRLAGEPELASPAGLFTALAAAICRYQVARAALVRDSDVLGRLARLQQGDPAETPARRMFVGYLDELRRNGLIRDDLGSMEQVNVVVAVFYGFLAVTPLLPGDLAPGDDGVARLVGETIGRTLAPARRSRRGDAEAIRRITMSFLGELADLARANYAKSVGTEDTSAGKDQDR